MSEQPVEAPAAAPETTVEAAIISPDAQVVEANLANAEPVTTDAIEPVATEAAPAEETPAAAEETPAEPAAPAAEKKEGSGLVAFIKKAIPNPKTVEKKAPKAETEAAPAPEIVEPAVEEGPFEGDAVTFKSHGGIFGYISCL
jgi:translation initiation factor IF-2